MRPILRRAIALVTLAVCLLATSRSFAQGNAVQITGTVTDASGFSLPGVSITATAATQQRQTVSDSGGRFILSGLTPGLYSVVVALPGFKPTRRQIAATAPGSIAANFALGIDNCDAEVLYVLEDAAVLWRRSSLAAHLLILSRSGEPRRDTSWCRAPYQYTATPLRERLNPPFTRSTGAPISVVTSLDLAPGDEGIGWLAWSEALQAFVFMSNGGEEMFSRRSDNRSVDEFFASLDSLSQTPDRK
jgi:hypothetical protein